MSPCPHCHAPDPGSGKFCIHCGRPLPESDEPTVQLDAESGFLGPPDSPPPSTQLTPPRATESDVRPPEILTPVGAMGPTSTAPASIWGPFAGYGMRGRHVAWLLDDLGKRAEDLRQTVADRFQRRAIPNAQMQSRILTAKGVLVEQRPYFLVRRGRATAGLYIAKFGQDLYISQVSYFKGPISAARVIIVLAIASFVFLYPAMLSSAMDSFSIGFGGVSGADNVFAMLCCLGPFYLGAWITLGLIALFALYKFITEKDILAPVRVQPNEFDQDDLIALEKAVEQTVRESLDVVGIEQELMPPAEEYGIRQRII